MRHDRVKMGNTFAIARYKATIKCSKCAEKEARNRKRFLFHS